MADGSWLMANEGTGTAGPEGLGENILSIADLGLRISDWREVVHALRGVQEPPDCEQPGSSGTPGLTDSIGGADARGTAFPTSLVHAGGLCVVVAVVSTDRLGQETPDMRSPWLSLVVGMATSAAFGCFAVWMMPITTGVTRLLATGGSTREAIDPVPGAKMICQIGVYLSVFGLIAGFRQMRHGARPRWAGIAGIVLGILNLGAWAGFVFFILPKFAELYKGIH
jgi:hypothetical protein